MKILLNWLRELCPTGLTDDEIAARLTFAGLEVEGSEKRTLATEVVAAKISSRTKVEGTHLSVCQVDDGSGEPLQIVCGADNYGAGDIVPLARVGAVLPDGKRIEKAKLRGLESSGMLCSARELGLSEDHAGLLLLPPGTKLGTRIEALLGLPDTVLEVNVTANRPDALSHLGVARDLAAIVGARALPPEVRAQDTGALPAEVQVDDAVRCPRYLARVIEGVRSAPSPLWIQERLRSCGVRPISNLVDATNLALLELGHPLHAFDLDQLAGSRIVVRRAAEGERLVTLDGKERKLTADDLVIADGARPVALAGVMGGQTSEVSAATTRILLESAVFEPAGVRRTARRHALHTEASHRFERGADETGALIALQRCAELIVQLAGGTILPGVIDRYPAPRPPMHVWVRAARVSAILGTSISAKEVDQRLHALGLIPVDGNDARRLWLVPPWRRDLTREIDCVEEVARLRGLDTIPIEVPKAGVGETAARVPAQMATLHARAALSAHGYDEVVNYSFVAERDLAALWPEGFAPAPIRVANPLTVEQGAMRSTLLAGLLRNLGYNLARGAHDLRLYELGRAYLPESDPRHAAGPLAWPVHEPRRLALAAFGHRAAKSWGTKDEPLDYFDLKGALEALLEAMGLPAARFDLAPSAPLHPASASALSINGVTLGRLGQVHPLVAKAFEVPASTLLAELDWDALLSLAGGVRQLHGVPRFPGVGRDLAFVVDDGVLASRMLAEIRSADAAQLLEQITLFDVYRGSPVPAGKKSIAYSLSLRAPDRTLTDAEADALCEAVKSRLEKELGAEIRR